MTPAEPQSLHELLDRVCDRLHSAEDMQRLNCLLSESAAARRKYRQLMDLHGRLMWEGDLGDSLLMADPPADAPAAPPPAPAIPHLFTGLFGALTRPRTFSFLFAAISIGVLLIMAAQIPMPGKSASSRTRGLIHPPPVFVASFVRGVDCTWAEGQFPKSAGLHLRQGEQIALRSGLAEIALRSGARLIIEGPAVLQLAAANAVQLDSGSLVSTVPPPAQGFTVDTPTARIVDRGTEFGVYVDAEQATEMQVFTGHVEVTLAADDRAQAPIVLHAGQSRRFAARSLAGSAGEQKARAAVVRSFVRELPTAAESLPDTGLLLVKNLTTGEVLFADDFEHGAGSAASGSRPRLPNNGAHPGKWRFRWPSKAAIQVVDARAPGPAQGQHYLRLYRASMMADADAIFSRVQSTRGDVIHFEAMLYLPADADRAVAQVLFRAPVMQDIAVSVAADGKGRVGFFDNTPGLAPGDRYRDSGLTYEPEHWQKWELDYAIGSYTASLTIAGHSATFPIVVPATSLASLGLRVGAVQKNPKPFYIDAVPTELSTVYP